MRILFIDDHPLVVAGLRNFLTALGTEVTIAHTLAEARIRLMEAEYDAWILDIDMPDGSGTHLLREMTLQKGCCPKALLLSGATDRDDIAMALDEGAMAFLSKAVGWEDLTTAVQRFLEMPEVVEEPLVWEPTRTDFVPAREVFPRGIVLSPREREVLIKMREGLRDKEIAHCLQRSIHTVRVQIRSIHRKRGRYRRAEVP